MLGALHMKPTHITPSKGYLQEYWVLANTLVLRGVGSGCLIHLKTLAQISTYYLENRIA